MGEEDVRVCPTNARGTDEWPGTVTGREEASIGGQGDNGLEDEALTLQNRLHEAAKILTSHGPATPSIEGLDRLRDLHPALKEDIPRLSTEADQFAVTKSRASKLLFPSAALNGDHWTPSDGQRPCCI